MKVNASLFGTGPVAGDVNQGEIGDCYFLSSLAAFAGENPQKLVQSAVDMGDGTFTAQFMSNNKPTFVRVSNAFSKRAVRWAVVCPSRRAADRSGRW